MAIDTRLQSVLSPEARVVLLTAGGPVVDPMLRAALSGLVSWPRVAWLADWEHASSVVWRRLSQTARDLVPDEVAAAWEPLAMVADFQASHLRDRFVDTLRALDNAGIPVILLKGAGLAHSAYANYLERPMGDIDLLVSPQRAQEAWSLAQRNGWTWNTTAYPAGKYAEHHHLPPLLDERRTGMKLELHTALSVFGHPFSFGYDTLLRSSREVLAAGIPARVLNESHQVVHLCVHFAWSHMMALGARRTFRDLRALIEQGRLSWDEVVKVSREHGAQSSVYWTLDLANRLVGVDVPDVVLRALRVPLMPGLGRIVERHLCTQLFASEQVCPSELVRRALWTAAIRPGRLRLGEGRPWDRDEVAVQGEASRAERSGRRIGQQLVSWGHYLRTVAVPR